METHILTDVLSDYFCIPCDLCQKYFEKDACPIEITKCNSKKHWELLLRRIQNEKD